MGLKRFLALAFLPVGLALSGCAEQYPQTFNNAPLPPVPGTMPTQPGAPGGAASGKTSGAVALLVPLTGDLAPYGMALENAAKLVFPDGTGLDVRDTGGNPAQAAQAAQAAIAAGDGIILGPLTSAEAHAVAPVAQAANVNVLAFTNDASVGAPGIWPLGISTTQQVKRVVDYAQAIGRTQVAGLLPDTDFGHSLGNALQAETSALGEPSPNISFYEPGFAGINQALRDVSDFADRGQGLMAQIKAAQDLNTAAGRQTARDLQHQQVPPPAFNALFIGATERDDLGELASLLPYYVVNQPQVDYLGPALWANVAPAMARNGVLNGSVYAAPDTATAAAFDQKYQSTYGSLPPGVADLGFDAAAIAHLIAGQGGYTGALLTDPAGFTGVDGLVQLQGNGQVQRGLAVFQVAPGAPSVVSPAPASLTQPSS